MKIKYFLAVAVMAVMVSMAVQAQQAPVPYGAKMDAMFKTFAGGAKAPAEVDSNLAETYELYGIPMATVIIQHQVDYNMFLAFLNGDTRMLAKFPMGEVRSKAALAGDNETMKTKKDHLMSWLNVGFGKLYDPVFSQFPYKPTADELMEAFDSHVKRNDFGAFAGEYVFVYQNPSEAFKINVGNTTLSDEDKAQALMAYKVWLADMMVFSKLMSSSGITLADNQKLAQTFNAYMMTICPTAK